MDDESIVDLLANLTVEEQAIIRPVLERDLEFQRREKLRLQELRELTVERKMSLLSSKSQESFASSMSTSVSPSSPSFRGCLTCGAKLGFILHTGGKCRKCEQLVCDSCKYFTSKDKSTWLCQLCFQERELQAASGEWADKGEVVSEQLLTHMRKAAMERNRSTSSCGIPELPNTVRHPRMNKRNMTLPSLSVMSRLTVPTEAEATQFQRREVTRKFWGGSPSPRSPSPRPSRVLSFSASKKITVSAGPAGVVIVAPTPPPNSLFPGMHPREVIGSPSPRSAPPFIASPLVPKMLPLTEVEAPTLTSTAPSPVAERRRQAFGSQKSETIYKGNHLLPVDPRPQKLLRRIPRISLSGSDPLLLDEWVPYRSPSPSNSQCSSDFLNNNDSRRPSAISTVSNFRRRSQKMKKSASRDTESTCSGCDYRDVASQASSQPTFVGEICLSCQYDPQSAILRVVVPQCRSLPHFGKHRPNPYVKLELSMESANVTESSFKTTTRYRSVDPLFGETFQFKGLSKSSLEQRRLMVSVWHREKYSKNCLIGEAILWLRDVCWHQPAPIWLPFQSVGTPDENKSSILNLRLSFKVRDNERGLGTFAIAVTSLEPRYQHELLVQVSLFLREQQLAQRVGSLSHSTAFFAEFAEINIHDLHLRSARIRLSKKNGIWKSRRLSDLYLNAWSHNVSRRTGCYCGCPSCQSWHKLTEKPYKDQTFGVSLFLQKWK